MIECGERREVHTGSGDKVVRINFKLCIDDSEPTVLRPDTAHTICLRKKLYPDFKRSVGVDMKATEARGLRDHEPRRRRNRWQITDGIIPGSAHGTKALVVLEREFV